MIQLVSDPNANEKLVSDVILCVVKYQPEVQHINFLDRQKARR
jgi:hypothetical protein